MRGLTPAWAIWYNGNTPKTRKAIKNFGEKGAWVYPETAQIFWVPPIISGTGKGTDFKFGQYIQSVHPKKSLLFPKIGGSQPPPKTQMLLSQERVKLRTSNLASTFAGSIRAQAH